MALVDDPQVPKWVYDAVLNAVQGSPAGCAVLVVGWWLRAALNKHIPDVTDGLKLLAMAIQASTLNAQQQQQQQPRQVTSSRVRKPKTDPSGHESLR